MTWANYTFLMSYPCVILKLKFTFTRNNLGIYEVRNTLKLVKFVFTYFKLIDNEL